VVLYVVAFSLGIEVGESDRKILAYCPRWDSRRDRPRGGCATPAPSGAWGSLWIESDSTIPGTIGSESRPTALALLRP
jgi:hypothetical protein